MNASVNELVTIIMPFYSHPEHFPRALESALTQTYSNLEVIVVDDGSPHDLNALIQPYLSDPRLRILCQPNSGVASARNTGIQAARGAYLQFLDADDWMASEKIERHVKALAKFPEYGLVFCLTYSVTNEVISGPTNMLADPRWDSKDGNYFNSFWAANRMPVTAPLIRTEWMRRVSGFDTSNLTEDYEMWLRLAGYGCRMLSIPEALVYTRRNPKGRSRDGGARNRRIATRRRIIDLFPDQVAEATEYALETWGDIWAENDAWIHKLERRVLNVSWLIRRSATLMRMYRRLRRMPVAPKPDPIR